MRGTEPPAAKRSTESPADGEHWMEKVCRRENLWKALDQVLANQGSAGMDGMTVKRLPVHLAKQHGRRSESSCSKGPTSLNR